MRNAKHIVFDRKNYVRYCEANPKVIWEKIDFTQYRNLVISTELIYRDYAELMEELDIRDAYELFYVIKSSIENWNTSLFEINCRRVPVIVMGDGSEEHQDVQLLKEFSPIDFQSYYEAYEERFGVRKESAQGNPTISSVLAIIIQKVYMPLMFRQLMKEMLLHSKRYWQYKTFGLQMNLKESSKGYVLIPLQMHLTVLLLKESDIH